jgi:hypothetical protein
MHPRVETYIESVDPQHTQLLYAVRQAIVDAHPAICEKFIYSTPFYALFSNFCYLTFSKKHQCFVLGFMQGYLMEDPYSLLRADSNQKYIRHIFLNAASLEQLHIIHEYLQLAVQLQAEKKMKKGPRLPRK